MSESKYRALLVEFVDLLSKRDMPGELALLGLSERIEAALAEPPVQAEPVAWLNVAADSVTNQLVVVMDWDDEGDEVQSLYLHPPAAQPNQHSRDSKELRDLCSQRDGFKAELWRAEGERDKLAAELAELKAKMSGVDERAAFEARFPLHDMSKRQDDDGDIVYLDDWTQGAFIGWQARAALSAPSHGEQVREWISIHDKMPKIGERCLIRIPVGRHFEIEGGEYKGEGDWLGAWCSRKGRNQTYKVSHWMYAPPAAPSKEGEV